MNFCLSDCPAGWLAFEGLDHCYQFVEYRNSSATPHYPTRGEAAGTCSLVGAYLTAIDSDAELVVLRSYIKHVNHFDTRTDPEGGQTFHLSQWMTAGVSAATPSGGLEWVWETGGLKGVDYF